MDQQGDRRVSDDSKPIHQRYDHLLDPGSLDDECLVNNCHPRDYQNPPGLASGQRYNLVVLGAGAAGLVSAGGCGLLGGRAALVERGLLGGDCLNTGCVPSKGLIRAARAVHDARMAGHFGLNIEAGASRVDFAAAMDRMRRLRARISFNDSVDRFREKYGVDVYLGEARFTAPDRVEVAGRVLRFTRAVIATGGRPAIPTIPGLDGTEFHTSETIFNLRSLPAEMTVIGGGPIACELAQAFQRFGSRVTILNAGLRLLPREDVNVSHLIESRLLAEGVSLRQGVNIQRVERPGTVIYLDDQRHEQRVSGGCILVAVGRLPNVEELGLAAAGVDLGADGIRVDDRLRTSNPRIYAAGDVCSSIRFTHAADAMARVVIRNALLLGRERVSRLVIPRVTYTDPEVAHVGLTKAEAENSGQIVETLTTDLCDNDRAILEGDEVGFVSVHIEPRSGRILGGTIVARQAGEMIGQLTLAMTAGLNCGTLARTIQPYPTLSDSLRRIGDAYELSRIGSVSRRLLRGWLAWNR